MSINYKIRQILNESIDVSEEERFTHAIREELDAEFNELREEMSSEESIDDNVPEDTESLKTPEQKLEDLIPLLTSVAKDENSKMQTPIIVNMIIEKAKEYPAEQLISFLSKKYNLQDAPEVENVVRELAEFNTTSNKTNTLVEQAKELAECMIPQIALAFKPAAGIESPHYVDRSREHVSKYINRVNGENVEINQALREMRALFDLDENLSTYCENVFKVAKGILDEQSLACIKENIGGTTSVDSSIAIPSSDIDKPLKEAEPETMMPSEPEPEYEEQDSDPTFYTEYRSLYSGLEPIAETIITDGALTEEIEGGFDYTHVYETLCRACTVAMKNGANGYGKDKIIEKIMEIMEEDFVFTENIRQDVSNHIRNAYEIGENYKKDLNKSIELYDECKSIDMTISLNEIVNMFSDDDNDDENVIEIDDSNDKIVSEEEEAQIVNSFNEIYNSHIGRAFET